MGRELSGSSKPIIPSTGLWQETSQIHADPVFGPYGEAQETIHVSGIGEPGEPGTTHCGLDFTPVNELVHLPVRLQPQMEIHKDHKKLGEAACTFTLLDVLGEIYWEISFHGNPESRDQRGAELLGSVRDVEEGLANLVPWELSRDPVN